MSKHPYATKNVGLRWLVIGMVGMIAPIVIIVQAYFGFQHSIIFVGLCVVVVVIMAWILATGINMVAFFNDRQRKNHSE